MIKIACNYTSELIELLDEKVSDVHYIKYPSLANDEGFNDYSIFQKNVSDILKHKPVLYHGTYPTNIFIGRRDFIKEFDIESYKDICKMSDTHGISLHYCGGDASLSKEETVKIAVKNLLYIKEQFPEMSFIAIENLAKTNNPYETDADVITEIVEKADVNFLYDISHAYKYTFDNELNFEEYVSKLPLHRLHEVHINGWKVKDKDVQAHMCIQDELYEHIEWIAKNTPVKIMTLEYGRHSDRINCGCPIVKIGSLNTDAKIEIRDQLERLHTIVKSI